jgi:transposase-like protein
MNFKSLTDLLDHFKDEATCIAYYENVRWNGNIVCPNCGSANPYKTTRGYKCSNNTCYKKFTVKVGTIFENSKIPLRTWFAAIYLCTTSKKGVSSVQLATQLGITQKSSWFLAQRIREMLKNQAPEMLGENSMVEADETFVGGKEKNRHKKKKQSNDNPELANDGTVYNKKKVVLGIIERGGKVILKYIPSATSENMVPIIENYVPATSKVFTDESRVYKTLTHSYVHGTVNHSLSIYVSGDIHTNTIENFWSVLKRGLYGIYHQVSDKHFERYLNEFAARYNSRDLKADERFEQFLASSESPLSYKTLISK